MVDRDDPEYMALHKCMLDPGKFAIINCAVRLRKYQVEVIAHTGPFEARSEKTWHEIK